MFSIGQSLPKLRVFENHLLDYGGHLGCSSCFRGSVIVFEETDVTKFAASLFFIATPNALDVNVVEIARVPERTRTSSKGWTERKRRFLRLFGIGECETREGNRWLIKR